MGKPNFANRTLWIDDNLRVLRGINSECVDLVATDPPFNSKRLYNAPLGSGCCGCSVRRHLDARLKSEWPSCKRQPTLTCFTPSSVLA